MLDTAYPFQRAHKTENMPVEYIAKASLLSLHGTARIMGVSEFTIIGFESIGDPSSPAYNYILGVAVPAAIMILFYFIWIIVLCTLKCCKRCCCPDFTQSQIFSNQTFTLALFNLFCLTSIIAWGVGLQGNVSTTQGFNAVINSIHQLEQFADEGLNSINSTRDTVNSISAQANMVLSACQNFSGDLNDPAVLQEPFDAAIDGLDQFLPPLRSQVDEAKSMIRTYLEMANSYLYWRETGTMIVLICLVVFLFLFLVVTNLRISLLHPEEINNCVRCVVISSKTYSWVIFILGVLLLVIAWVFIALFHVIGTVGSDVCAPDVNANLNRLILEATTMQPISGSACVVSADPIVQGLCYYQTCAGNNPLNDMLSQIPNITDILSSNIPTVNVTEMIVQAIPDFNLTEVQGLLAANNLTSFFEELDLSAYNQSVAGILQDLESCVLGFVSFSDFTLNAIGNKVNEIVSLTDCETSINPVYANLVYDGLCNGFVDGFYVSYVCYLIGSIFMMMALTTYRVFEFGDIAPTATEVVYLDAVLNPNAGNAGDRDLKSRRVSIQEQSEADFLANSNQLAPVQNVDFRNQAFQFDNDVKTYEPTVHNADSSFAMSNPDKPRDQSV